MAPPRDPGRALGHPWAPQRDPWVPKGGDRETLPPPIRGYTGAVPRVRPEHVGPLRSEQQEHFTPMFGTAKHQDTKGMAPGGGSSALGTAPMPVPGQRTYEGRGIYQSLEVVRASARS